MNGNFEWKSFKFLSDFPWYRWIVIGQWIHVNFLWTWIHSPITIQFHFWRWWQTEYSSSKKKCIDLFYCMFTNILLTVHLILPFSCRLRSSNSEKPESSSSGFILCGDKYGTYEWKKKKNKRSLSKSLHIIFVCRWSSCWGFSYMVTAQKTYNT